MCGREFGVDGAVLARRTCTELQTRSAKPRQSSRMRCGTAREGCHALTTPGRTKGPRASRSGALLMSTDVTRATDVRQAMLESVYTHSPPHSLCANPTVSMPHAPPTCAWTSNTQM